MAEGRGRLASRHRGRCGVRTTAPAAIAGCAAPWLHQRARFAASALARRRADSSRTDSPAIRSPESRSCASCSNWMPARCWHRYPRRSVPTDTSETLEARLGTMGAAFDLDVDAHPGGRHCGGGPRRIESHLRHRSWNDMRAGRLGPAGCRDRSADSRPAAVAAGGWAD